MYRPAPQLAWLGVEVPTAVLGLRCCGFLPARPFDGATFAKQNDAITQAPNDREFYSNVEYRYADTKKCLLSLSVIKMYKPAIVCTYIGPILYL